MDVVIPFAPRPWQAEVMRSRARFAVIVVHRRAGKTAMLVAKAMQVLLECQLPRPRAAIVLPELKQARREVWPIMLGLHDPLRRHLGLQPNHSELFLPFPRDGRMYLLGADNPDAIRGGYWDWIGLDEYAQMPPIVDDVIMPALADRRGAMWLCGTPKGRHNDFWRRYDAAANKTDWYRTVLRWQDTRVLPQEEIELMRQTMPEEVFRQEFECSFEAPNSGSYYGRLIDEAEAEGRLTDIPYDPRTPAEAWFDLGVDDATAIWVVQHQPGGRINVVRYYESSGHGADHYADWLRRTRYDFKRLVLPHDAANRAFASGVSAADVFEQHGFTVEILPNRVPVVDGINAVRMLLPRCWFNTGDPEMARGLQALREYQREWDAKAQTWRQTPRHDWSSHAADAFRYGAVVAADTHDRMQRREQSAQIIPYNPLRWGRKNRRHHA